MPVTMFTAFVRRFAKDRRVRFFFLDLKIPADLPDLVPPMFQHAPCRPCAVMARCPRPSS